MTPFAWQKLRQFAAAALFDPLDLDVAEMRLAVGIGVEVVDARVYSILMIRELSPTPLGAFHRNGIQ